ncbi:TPA: HpaII family restriction endonuclease [Bacillus wiedmannii]|uniref:HpaII family restriction endonuclease n=1 Tax=Bacillus thuringiensis TaxID=1428 RepID=UPI000BFE1A4E|nr:HpaII family restriction endonuclease [Bacillus thuringiensis]PGO55544.1 restriction endonuclease [Bacillus thuringiensis]HDR7673289.1 HpaII family restriction endonuclease [Bacillus wiedmannii]
MVQRYNKGEWSEPYVLLKLLAEGKLHAADENLNAIPDLYYPLINVLRFEAKSKFVYGYENYSFRESTNIRLTDSSGITLAIIPINDFKEKSLKLFEEIKAGSGTFPVSTDIENFLQAIKVTKKAEKPTKKRDITIIVHDEETGHEPELGFSIKSKLGGPATLLNAAHTTNFIYKLEGGSYLTDTEIKDINLSPTLLTRTLSPKTIADKNKYGFDAYETLKSADDIISAMEAKGYTIRFLKTESEIFSTNLQMFDSNFPFVFAEFLLANARNYCTNKMEDILTYIESKNPCNYNLAHNHPIYRYKMKNLLTDASLGMMPGQVWNGKYDATGGYIIVKESGELVCYHIYNRDEFQEYLIKNTYLESASRFKHGYGFVYRENGELFFKLNLQIRFQ